MEKASRSSVSPPESVVNVGAFFEQPKRTQEVEKGTNSPVPRFTHSCQETTRKVQSQHDQPQSQCDTPRILPKEVCGLVTFHLPYDMSNLSLGPNFTPSEIRRDTNANSKVAGKSKRGSGYCTPLEKESYHLDLDNKLQRNATDFESRYYADDELEFDDSSCPPLAPPGTRWSSPDMAKNELLSADDLTKRLKTVRREEKMLNKQNKRKAVDRRRFSRIRLDARISRCERAILGLLL